MNKRYLLAGGLLVLGVTTAICGLTACKNGQDPLPFDVNAPVIEIEDRDFAWFYRDMAENTAQYVGKTVRFKGMTAVTGKSAKGTNSSTTCLRKAATSSAP